MDFHHVFIHAKKYLEKVWYDLSYVVFEENIFMIINKWSSNWLTLSIKKREKVDIRKTQLATRDAHTEKPATKEKVP